MSTVIADGVLDVDGTPYRYEVSVDLESLVAAYVPRAARNTNHLATIAYGIIKVTAQAPSGWAVRNPDGTWTHTPHGTRTGGAGVTLDELIEQAHRTALSKGWWDDPERSMGDQFANFHSELSEAWEEYRAGHPLGEIRLERDAKPDGFVVELADLFIRVADTLGAYGLEQAFAEALEAKLAYNQTRPYRHGNLKA